MKIETARVVVILCAAGSTRRIRAAANFQLANRKSHELAPELNSDAVQTAVVSVCVPRSSKPTQTGRARTVIHQDREKTKRLCRWANGRPDKFANTRRQQRQTSRASRDAGKRTCKKRQLLCWSPCVRRETTVPIGCDRRNR